jgi:hypothetical protein
VGEEEGVGWGKLGPKHHAHISITKISSGSSHDVKVKKRLT